MIGAIGRSLLNTARNSDLGLQDTFVSMARMQLANQMTGLFTQSASINTSTPNGARDAQKNQAEISAIQNIDKKMEIMAQRIKQELEARQKEEESVRKMISQDMQAFKTFA